MPHQKNRIKSKCRQQLTYFIPVTGLIFTKKPSEEPVREHSIDFHVEMVKKIDKLLKEHDLDAQEDTITEEPPVTPIPAQTPVEIRDPLNRQVFHGEVTERPRIDPFFSREIPTPEEFKTDFPLSMNQAFKFITALDEIEGEFQEKKRDGDRVEVINVNSFMFEDDSDEKTRFPVFGKRHIQQKPPSYNKSRNKIEVIDTRTIQGKAGDYAFFTALQQSESNEQKSQLYYLISRNQKEKKLQKIELDRSYIPVDFEERSKQIREKQQQEIAEKKEQKKKETEKEQKTREREEEKLEEQKRKQKEQKQQKKREEPSEKSPSKKSDKGAKKLEKEQKKLEKLEMKKARIEEKQRQKAEKKAVKQQQKLAKKQQKLKPEKIKKEKEKFGVRMKEKPEESLLLDDDLRKILVITDGLLGELPEEVIDRFTQSEDFVLYEKVLSKYKIK